MNSFTKPNVNLPVSLHDARVSAIQITASPKNGHDGVISFVFENGFKLVNGNPVTQTRKASVKITGVDFDFSHVYYSNQTDKCEIDFERLSKDVKAKALDIIDESYGYNLTRFSCQMISSVSWHEVEIEIYHFDETLYEWEN